MIYFSRRATIRHLHIHGRILPTLALVLATPLAAASQEGAAQQADAPDNWKVSAEFSLTDQSGNKDLSLLTGGLNVAHLRRENYRFDASVQSRYGRSSGEVVAMTHTGTLAIDLAPRGTFSPFLTINGERDAPKRLDLRLATGAGAKLTISRSQSGTEESSVSLALLHSYERIAPKAPDLIGEPPLDRGESKHLARWSLRGATTRQLRPGVTFRHSTYYQPVWGTLADYLLRSDTGVKILLTKQLAVSIDYELKREARPPEGVEPNDRLLKTGLIFDF